MKLFRSIRLFRGDISLAAADAIATSSNTALCGNANPNYWRFNGRKSADGAIRMRAGKGFAALAFAALPGPGVLLPRGAAVTSPAAGDLRCEHVVHAVAPDGLRGGEDGAFLLRQTYAAVLAEAQGAGARTLACPAIGCGVMGFRPGAAASEAFAVASAWLSGGAGSLEQLTFWILSDDVWRSWPACAEKQLGPAARIRTEIHNGVEKTLEYEWTSTRSAGKQGPRLD